jgi:hypothetical protein
LALGLGKYELQARAEGGGVAGELSELAAAALHAYGSVVTACDYGSIDDIEPALVFVEADLEVDIAAAGAAVVDAGAVLDVEDAVGGSARSRGVYTQGACDAAAHIERVPVAHDAVVIAAGSR